jgi:glycine cleavage system H protein
VSDFEYPDDLRYTAEHEWVRIQPGGDVARVGITAFAQDALGDIVFVTLPDEGAAVTAGSPCGEVESTKSVSDVYAPLTGTVSGRNEALDASPELVNSDPYGEGWMFEVRVDDPGAVDGLMSAEEYQAQLG